MAILDSIKKFVFPVIDEDDDEMEVETAKPAPRVVKEDNPAPGIRKARVLNLSSGAVSKIVVVKLDSNAGVKVIIDNLKERTPVVFNIARLDRSDATRVVDVVYGASYAADGSMQKVSNDIFVVAPSGVEITGDITEKILGADDFSLDI